MSWFALPPPLSRVHSFRAPLLAVAAFLSCSQAQLPPLGGGPSPNSLLNDLRAIQFPPAGGQATPPTGGGMASGMGLGLGGLGTPTGAMPSMPMQPQGFGGQMGAMPSMQPQGFGSQFGAAPTMQPQGLGGLGGFGGSMPGAAQMGGAFGGGGLGAPPPSMPTMGAAGMPPQGVSPETPDDLGCTTGAHAVAWQNAKQRFRSVTSAPLALAPREVLVGALEGAIADLKVSGSLSTQASDECGFGKLFLQLMSIATVDDPAGLAQVFSAIEQIASPVLTLALDVPWDAVAKSGWPFFGILAQINLRKVQAGTLDTSGIDGLGDPWTQSFHAELIAALSRDGAAIEAASSTFLKKESQSPSGLATLTAMSAQAAGQTELPVRSEMLVATQAVMKQVIGDAGELDIALSTSWPLWGLLHIGVDSLATA